MADKNKRRSKKEDEYISYSEQTEQTEQKLKKKRNFPKKNVVLISIIIILQIGLGIFAILYEPKPQDIIENYDITVTPNANGSLDIEYSLKWTALDMFEDLTWVTIGTANSNFDIISDSCSDNIASIEHNDDDYGYSSVRIDFDRPYYGGETFDFSFKIRQYDMLCSDDDGMFYEFIPGWFDSTPVKNYTVRWVNTGIKSANNDTSENGYNIWQGEMKCGKHVETEVRYPNNYFKNAAVVNYEPFDSVYVNNEFDEISFMVRFACIVMIFGGVIAEIVIIDGFISYNRGRGFITGYGYPMHAYGRVNPRYISAKNAHNATKSSSGFYGGGGCACACACACAGGGRAGCSQKDTYKNTEKKDTMQ